MPRVKLVKVDVRRYVKGEKVWRPAVPSKFSVETTIGSIFSDPKVTDMVIGYGAGDFVSYSRPVPMPVAGAMK